jgi:hypothetical protein
MIAILFKEAGLTLAASYTAVLNCMEEHGIHHADTWTAEQIAELKELATSRYRP